MPSTITGSIGVFSARSVTVVDESRLTITVPQMAAYDILSAQEARRGPQRRKESPCIAHNSLHGRRRHASS